MEEKRQQILRCAQDDRGLESRPAEGRQLSQEDLPVAECWRQ